MSSTPPLPPLAITALSPVATGASFCRLSGVLWATVIVKATFELVPGEAARLVAPLDLVREDRAGSAGGSLTHARETAPHLPNAGVVLTGHACAPDGRAVPSMSVRLGLSRDRPLVDRTIHVFGARAADNPGAIAPFQKMPVVYERALGGPGFAENPVGTGGPGSRLLPNFVDPKDPRKVACFGPVAADWAPRRALLGGLDPRRVEAAVWEVPAGFDWRVFQAAPAEQQCERLHGDEWIVLDGMDAALPRVQSRLPQVTALARRQGGPGGGGGSEEALPLRADMLVIDADRRVASLIWRERFAVAQAADLERGRVLVGLEMPGRAIPWPSPSTTSRAQAQTPQKPQASQTAPQPQPMETQEVNLAALLGGVVPFSGERESAAPSPVSVAADSSPAPAKPMFTGTEAFDLRSLLKQPVPFAAAAATMDLKCPVPSATGSVVATLDTMSVPQGVALPFAHVDPTRPPQESVPTAPVLRPTPSYTGTTDINLAQVLRGAVPYQESPEPSAVLQVVPAAAGVAPFTPVQAAIAPPPPISFALAVQPHESDPRPGQAPATPPQATPALLAAVPVHAPLEIAPALSVDASAGLTTAAAAPPIARAPTAVARRRKDAEEKLARKEPFDGESFEGANLSALDFSGCSLLRCNLRGATLRGATLCGARLGGALLDEADLRGAALEEADLSDASLLKANLERAKLGRCHGERANLREANLLGADLRDGHFASATFAGSVLRDATADRSDFNGARFDHADARGVCLRHATLTSAVFAHADLEGANLRNANLRGANMHKTIRRMAKLAGADLDGVDEAAPAKPAP